MLQRARERSADQWMAAFRANGNVAADDVGTAQTALQHADLLANGGVIEREDPNLGTIHQAGPIAQLRRTPAQIERPAPELGEHSAEVLAETPRRSDGALGGLGRLTTAARRNHASGVCHDHRRPARRGTACRPGGTRDQGRTA